MQQASVVAAAIAAAFVLYLAANNRLGVYLGMIGL